MLTGLRPGDVLCIADNTKAGWFIRLRGKLPWTSTDFSPGKFSHVAVVMHIDARGLPWGIEGKPSKVEFVDLTKYLDKDSTISNRNQGKTDEQREGIVKYMLSLYAVKYDWSAIINLGMKTFGQPISFFAREWNDRTVPKTVVCSSSADAAYEFNNVANPGGSAVTRLTTPDMWGDFILRNGLS